MRSSTAVRAPSQAVTDTSTRSTVTASSPLSINAVSGPPTYTEARMVAAGPANVSPNRTGGCPARVTSPRTA